MLLATGRASAVPTSLVDECYRRAEQARRCAEVASMPSQKTHFLDLEQRWLRAAESVARTVRETGAPIAQPNIATPNVDQPLHGAQGNDVAAPRRPDEIGDEQARSANLTLTIQYGGLEQTIQLPLSNEEIGKLVLQADVRDVSVGQLVGMLLEAAMAQDLPRVLDKKRAEEPE
jgi:hypothetical protein